MIRNRQQRWGDKEKATRKRRQGRGDKEEATRRNPSQCGSRARSRRVAGDLSPWRRERRGACSGSLTIGSLTLKELYSTLFWPSPSSSKSLIIQVLYHPSPLSSKSLIIQVSYHPSLSSTKPRPSSLKQSRFFFPCFQSRLEGFFIDDIYTYNLLVFLSVSLIGWGVFYQLIPCPVFFFSLPITELRGFSPVTWPFETYQLLYGARMFSVVTQFSSSVSHHLGWEVFHQVPIPGSLQSPFQQIPRLAELVSEEGGNCNNVTFEVKVIWQLPTTT